MARSAALATALVTVLAFSGCGQDVVIDVDNLPTGNAEGNSGSGVFTYSEVVKRSSCPETHNGVTLPQKTDVWDSTVTLQQDYGYYKMTIEPSGDRPGYEMDGGIFWYGNYRIGGTYWWLEPGAYPGIKFINLNDGRYVDGVNDIEGETVIRVMEDGVEDGLDCEITVVYTGQREI